MSFGRRLALFFVLIALVPTLALLAMLVLVSDGSARGEADARLSAALDTAQAVYDGHVAEGRDLAQSLADDPAVAAAVRTGDPAGLRAVAKDAGVRALELTGPGGETLVAAGPDDAIAYGQADLSPGGTARVSTVTAPAYEIQVRRLTKRPLVVERDGLALAGTAPDVAPDAGETVELELDGNEYRARAVDLGSGESLLLLGPRPDGGFLGIDTPTIALLIALLLLGLIIAFALARTLTGLHSTVEAQAQTDPLTGLWNRRRMFQLLDRELERARRFGHELSVLIIDIDEFKQINDEHGHPQGDDTLKAIADTINDQTRSIDVGARYGGDELVLLLLETGTDGALVVAERLREKVGELDLPLAEGGTMGIKISLGLATMPAAAEQAKDLVEAADQALLAAKRSGKDQVGVAPEMLEEARAPADSAPNAPPTRRERRRAPP